MLKQSCNLLKSTRLIVCWNSYRCSSSSSSSSSTDKPKKKIKIRQEVRWPDGQFDLHSPTIGSGTRGATTEEVMEQIANNPEFFRDVFKSFWQDCKDFKKELKENYLREDPIEPPNGTIDMVYTFENEEKLDNFVVTTDEDHDVGHSVADLTTTSRETALFSGYLCNKLKPDGLTKWAGYVNFNSKRPMLAFSRPTYHDWSHYTHLVLKIRGDGRSYNVILGCPGYFEQSRPETFLYPLYTRGGPYWQIAKIPFSKFIFGAGGYLQSRQYVLTPDRVARIGVTLADNINGPFSLEVEYIGVERNEYHGEITAYETYTTDRSIPV